MHDRVEVLVLGAGIAGAATAYHLARRSVGRIALFDPRTPAAGATGRAAGIVTEQLWDRWDVETVRASKEEFSAIAAGTDPPAYRENGFARWTSDPTVAPVLRAAQERLRGWGVPVRSLSASELGARLPWLRTDGIREASWDPHDSVVAPSTLAEIYVARARTAGAECLLGERFDTLRRTGSEWELVAAQRTLAASAVVVAAGAWSKGLLRSIGTPLPLAPYRTQAAYLRPPGPPTGLFPSFHDLDADFYVRPEENGRILAGDGTRLTEVDPDTAPPGGDEEFVAHIAQSFADRCPGWADSELVRAWSGVCASTPDRRPLVGPVPGADGLFCLCGFNGFGVMRAAGAARRLVDVIAANGPGPADEGIASVRPGRFGPNPRPFAPRPGFTLEGGDDPRF